MFIWGILVGISFFLFSFHVYHSWEEQKAQSLSVFCFLPPIRASSFLVVFPSLPVSVWAFASGAGLCCIFGLEFSYAFSRF